jgi:FkbH-like protein
MVSVVEGFTSFNTPRVAQLSQRSNQFNLRTVRYTDGEIAALGASDKHVCLSFTLEDKFGDNGLICVIIMSKRDAKTLFIDTWFMSCRVLKRGMENFTLNTMVEYAKAHGFERIVGEYIPTLKNGMVKEHYPNLGFKAIGENLYELDVNSYSPRECYIHKR